MQQHLLLLSSLGRANEALTKSREGILTILSDGYGQDRNKGEA